MQVHEIIGMRYRLGASPEEHGKADCLSMCRTVLSSYNISTPAPKRDWYRRLRRGDYNVFKEELEKWGEETTKMMQGTVALCEGEGTLTYGMAVWWYDGWLSFTGEELTWKPASALRVVALYCPKTSR